MHNYKKYLIKDTDKFDPDYFTSVNDEITSINEKIQDFPAAFKTEIIVSFLKDHSLQNDWKDVNPGLTSLVTSGTLFAGNIESLFESSQGNPVFRQHLENYLVKRFSEN